MKPLVMRRNSILYKLARNGGLPSDLLVADKEALKYNDNLGRLLMYQEISKEYFQKNKRSTTRDANLCDVARYILNCLTTWTFIILLGGFIVIMGGILVVSGVMGLVEKMGLINALAIIASSAAVVVGLGVTFVELRNRREKALASNRYNNDFQTKDINKAAETLQRIEARELRKGLYQALKQKTCYLVEIKDD